MSEQTFCMECGNKLEAEATFCSKCGIKLGSFSSNVGQNEEEKTNLVQDPFKQAFSTSDGFNDDDVFASSQNSIATQTQPVKKIKNPVAFVAIIIDLIGFLFFIAGSGIMEWMAVGCGGLGILVGIVSFFLKKDKSLSIIGIILGVVVIVSWSSIVYGWPI